MTTEILKRIGSMDGAELKFRATSAIRRRVGRARTALTPPTWRREALQLSALAAPADARQALARRDWQAAHLALATHFATREPRFPLDPRRIPAHARDIQRRFPRHDARLRAEQVLSGRYDILGYRGVAAGSPPDWHADPVHGHRAPLLFWDSVPYLDPAYGDHKITWEINRHQHFLALGRAFALTGDRRYYREFVVHLESWIETNPPLQGTNWASMLELAFRTLSWTWALHFFAPAAAADDPAPWVIDLLMALDRQITHVEQNLSRYFSPNTHLTGEALALYVVGRALPELQAASRWEETGRHVLLDETTRQVLPDGGHAELSAHYHRYSTDFYLLAFNTARLTRDTRATRTFRDSAHRQSQFLRALADDRGWLPLIGDDDGGQLFPMCGRPPADAADTLATAAVVLDDASLAVGPIPEETLWACGTTLDVPETLPHSRAVSAGFEHSGYYICRDTAANHLVFDCGRHGFLNGGHAHADALSIVASVGARPLLIDPGTATYTMDLSLRDLFRSTAMHNTVVVNGRNQSEPRGPFHWSTVTNAQCLAWRPGGQVDYAEGCHDGYAPIRHLRRVFAIHGVGWVVVDHLSGPSPDARASVMWHVHPDWHWARTSERGVKFRHVEGTEASLAMSVPVRSEAGTGLDGYAPEYGQLATAPCLSGAMAGPLPLTVATFVACAPDWQTSEVHVAPEGFRIDALAGSLIVDVSSGRAALVRLPSLASSMQLPGRL
jgi:hypothetical protein